MSRVFLSSNVDQKPMNSEDAIPFTCILHMYICQGFSWHDRGLNVLGMLSRQHMVCWQTEKSICKAEGYCFYKLGTDPFIKLSQNWSYDPSSHFSSKQLSVICIKERRTMLKVDVFVCYPFPTMTNWCFNELCSGIDKSK